MSATIDADVLPTSMLKACRWMLWKLEANSDKSKKPRKVPYYVSGKPRSGSLDSPDDVARLSSFDDAYSKLKSGRYAGLGFALGADGTGKCWQGIDLDDVPIRPHLTEIHDDLPGYTESSPSGKGYHAIGYGRPFDTLGSNTTGIEAYSHGRFFTVTGEGSGIHDPVCMADFVEQRLKPIHSPRSAPNASKPSRTASQTVQATITPQQVTELRSALLYLRADDRDAWIANGHALKELGEVGRGLWMEWSATSDKFDPAEAARTWDSFQPSHTGYQAVFKRAQEAGWINPASNAAQSLSEADLSALFNAPALPDGTTPQFSLDAFALNGSSGEMEYKMLEDKFILGRIALLGQSTVIYAAPNVGKTLMTMWLIIDAIKRGEMKGKDIYYINADDNHKGLTTKLKLAEEYGFVMLAPSYYGFKPAHLPAYLAKLNEQDTARGKVLILDTVKKFTDLMDKKIGSAFGEAVRQFVSHGGSVIMLAHVNKNRDPNGKVIRAGTSDIQDDCDCSYTLDGMGDDQQTGIRTVQFKNEKNRGDVALEAVYSYNYSEGVDYKGRLESVTALGDADTKAAQTANRLKLTLESNRDAITAIIETIRGGVTLKTELIKAATDLSLLTVHKIKKALKEHEGESVALNQFWQVSRADKNAHVYRLNALI